MNITTLQTVILNTLTTFSLAVLGIITAIISIGVAYLIFTVGWHRLINDQSLMLGGYYLRKKPYANYNRFHSQKWNMTHTM